MVQVSERMRGKVDGRDRSRDPAALAPVVAGPFTLPVGYHRFHRDQLFNYQLNRPHSLGSGRYEDLAEAGARISSFSQWKTEMGRQATRAEAEGRWRNAAAYWRAAEFYTFADDPDKTLFYDRFLESFHAALAGEPLERVQVPYGTATLPALVVDAPRAVPRGAGRGTVLLHGGYDSFIEEFYPLLRFFSDAGLRAIGFEGPGQGGARRRAGLPMDWRWEGPVGAVLDHFALDDVTLVGLSMGGYFALRAAAFEKRVRRVIASGHAFDYTRVAPAPARWLMTFFHDHLRELTNRVSRWKMRSGGMEAWNIGHMMYIRDTDEPMAALDFALELTEANLRCDRITQDVLLLASTDDHFIPFRLHAEQVRRLVAARSVTDRVFTKAEHAGSHCQIGNVGLALRVMRDWIENVDGGRPVAR